MLRESVVSVIPLLPQITGVGLSVVSKAFVIPHFLLLLYLALSAQEKFSCAREYIVTQERRTFLVPIAGIGVSNRRTPWFRRILELDITARTATESIARIERSSVSKRAKSIASSERLRQSGQSRASAKNH